MDDPFWGQGAKGDFGLEIVEWISSPPLVNLSEVLLWSIVTGVGLLNWQQRRVLGRLERVQNAQVLEVLDVGGDPLFSLSGHRVLSNACWCCISF